MPRTAWCASTSPTSPPPPTPTTASAGASRRTSTAPSRALARLTRRHWRHASRSLYDGEDILLEYDGANVLQARYSHGQRTDQPLGIERGATLAFFQADHLGSIRQVTNAAGSVVNAYDYDSYGNFETLSESLPQPYAFTGREFDPESGLHYYRARYYEPATGRFISEDPVAFNAEDTNLYRYVYGDPVNLIDPDDQLLPIIGAFLGLRGLLRLHGLKSRDRLGRRLLWQGTDGADLEGPLQPFSQTEIVALAVRVLRPERAETSPRPSISLSSIADGMQVRLDVEELLLDTRPLERLDRVTRAGIHVRPPRKVLTASLM